MKWSAKLDEFAGIKVYVHATFLILIAWLGFAHSQAERSAEAVVAGVLSILALFACVLLHEFGHALTAKRFGIKARDITLLPIGGVARLERMPEDQKQELWVTLAGPAVNVVIAGALYVLLLMTGTLAPTGTLTLAAGSFWERLMVLNVLLVVFNMISAPPMDGGRALRAVLAMRMDYTRAAGSPPAWDRACVLTRADLLNALAKQGEQAAVSDVMQRDFPTADPAEMIDVVLQRLQGPKCHTVPVLQRERLIGLITMENVCEFISVQAARGSATRPTGVSLDRTLLTNGTEITRSKHTVS